MYSVACQFSPSATDLFVSHENSGIVVYNMTDNSSDVQHMQLSSLCSDHSLDITDHLLYVLLYDFFLYYSINNFVCVIYWFACIARAALMTLSLCKVTQAMCLTCVLDRLVNICYLHLLIQQVVNTVM